MIFKLTDHDQLLMKQFIASSEPKDDEVSRLKERVRELEAERDAALVVIEAARHMITMPSLTISQHAYDELDSLLDPPCSDMTAEKAEVGRLRAELADARIEIQTLKETVSK